MKVKKAEHVATYLRQQGYDSRILEADIHGMGCIVLPITYGQCRTLADHFEAGGVDGHVHYNTSPGGDDLRVVVRMSKGKINLLCRV